MDLRSVQGMAAQPFVRHFEKVAKGEVTPMYTQYDPLKPSLPTGRSLIVLDQSAKETKHNLPLEYISPQAHVTAQAAASLVHDISQNHSPPVQNKKRAASKKNYFQSQRSTVSLITQTPLQHGCS